MSEESVLVVGATGGLGKDVVRTLASRGFSVHFTGRRSEPVAALAKELPEADGHVVEALEEGAIRGMIQEIDAKAPLVAYVHLAGGYSGGKRIDELDDGDWAKMMEANWTTLRNGASAAFRVMRSRGSGSIVTIGSLPALNGAIGVAPYAVAKASVVAFTRCLAEEGKAYGVRANCIVPGIINTAGNRKAMPEADTKTWVAAEQVARAIAFLCGPSSAGITGSVILMKGGI